MRNQSCARGCTLPGLSLLLAALFPAAPLAAAGVPAVHGSVAALSSYRFRGLGYSGGDPAAQASLGLSGASGPFASAFLSTLGARGSGNAEVNASIGWTARLPLIDLSLGGTAYAFPGSGRALTAEAFATASLPLGPATATAGATLSPARSGLQHSSYYVFGRLRFSLPATPLSIEGSVGHEGIAARDGLGRPVNSKNDWQVGADYRFPLPVPSLVLGARYVGNSLRQPVLFDGGFRPNSGNAFVLSLTAGF